MLRTNLSGRLRNILSGESIPPNTKDDVVINVPAVVIAEAIAGLEAASDFSIKFDKPKHLKIEAGLVGTPDKDGFVALTVTGLLVRGNELVALLDRDGAAVQRRIAAH